MNSNDIEELQRSLDQKRSKLPPKPKLKRLTPQTQLNQSPRPRITPEEEQRRDEIRRLAKVRDEARQEKARQHRRLERLGELRGKLYVGCRLSNYETPEEWQRAAVGAVRDYAKHVAERIAEGVNVILTGQKGTGKDHLLYVLMRAAVADGLQPEKSSKPYLSWTTGNKLFMRYRATIDSKAETEADIVKEYTRAAVLCISDPLPEVTPKDYQLAMLYEILDQRNADMSPTWITVNATGRGELDAKLGSLGADRLRQGALVVDCRGESYRKPSVTVTSGRVD